MDMKVIWLLIRTIFPSELYVTSINRIYGGMGASLSYVELVILDVTFFFCDLENVVTRMAYS